MTPYEKLERAYDQYFKQLEHIDKLYEKCDRALERSDWWTCYKTLFLIRKDVDEANKRIEKAKTKYMEHSTIG